MKNIFCVVPTIRKESMDRFKKEWEELFLKHKVILVEVIDGEEPKVIISDYEPAGYRGYGFEEKYDKLETDLFTYNYNDGIRNLGFYIVAKNGKYGDTVITLDDDCYPGDRDPIQEHLDILGKKVPTSWIPTADEYMRGFPYGVREESEVLVSHGVWDNVPDLDAPTQLVKGVREYQFPKMIVPKGIYFPFCIMNVAFKYEALPYMYQAPAGRNCPHGIDRFADIWCGINLVRYAQEHNFAIATGYSKIWHDRASDVFTNLIKEAKGIGLNETYWQGVEEDEYFKLYNEKRNLWKEIIELLMD